MKKIIIIAFAIMSLHAQAQEEKYKALFIYKFIQNLEYPSGKNSDQYNIGILGSKAVFNQLSRMTSERKVNGKAISVQEYTPGTSMDPYCIVFLANSSKDLFESMNKEAVANSTVLVSETPGLGKKGAAINFINNQGKLGFEINLETLDASEIRVSSTLKSLGKLVK